MTEKERELKIKELERCISQFQNFGDIISTLKEFLRIRTETGEIIPLIPNESQIKILELIIPLLRVNKPIRLIILKARQQGISTLIQAIFFIVLYVSANLRALTMGHELDSSNNLFNMYDVYYKELPKYLQPTLEFSNEKKKKYLANQCENKVATAGKGEVGRSDTLQLLHLTEVAFYPDAKKTLGALLQAAKYAKIIVIESTANGIGDEFYNMYWEAKEPNSLSEYIPIFLSWLDFPKYSKPFNNETERQNLLRDLGKNHLFNEYENEEILLKDKYNATLEQLNWRRFTIVNTCQKDVKTFHQEYPRDDVEAFVASGRPVFDSKVCNENLTTARILENAGRQPIAIGNLYPVYDETEAYKALITEGKSGYYDLLKHLKEIKFVSEVGGYVKIYDKIEISSGEKNRFAAGSDVAEGLEQGDYDAIKILDRKTMKVAITWHGHTAPDLFGIEHHKLQTYLKGLCWFGIERNNHGLSTIYKARDLGVNLYWAQEFKKGYVETGGDLLGFKTTQTTRTPALNELSEWIREGTFIDYEKEYWQEALTFVRNAKGKMQAQDKDTDPGTKCFDDRIIASMIMIRVHLWMPNYKPPIIDNAPKWLKKLHPELQKAPSFMES